MQQVVPGTSSSPASIPPEDKIKFLNDLDARTLIEANVDLRHQETIGFATLAAFVAALYYISQYIHVPSSQELNSVAPGCARVRAIMWSLGLRFSFFIPLISIIPVLVGVTSGRNARDAEARMQILYVKFASRNQIDQDELIQIQDFRQRSRRRKAEPEIFTLRRTIPDLVLLVGILCAVLPLFVKIFTGLLCGEL